MIDWTRRIFEPSKTNGSSSIRALLERIGLVADTRAGKVLAPIDAIDAEIGRARRYEHSLSLVVVETMPLLDAGGNGGNGTGGETNGHTIETSVPQMVSLVAAATLIEVLRESDVVCYQPAENRFLVALTQTDDEEARGAIGRIETLFRDRLRLVVRAGVARFPDDALTRSALIAKAGERANVAAPETDAPAGADTLETDAQAGADTFEPGEPTGADEPRTSGHAPNGEGPTWRHRSPAKRAVALATPPPINGNGK